MRRRTCHRRREDTPIAALHELRLRLRVYRRVTAMAFCTAVCFMCYISAPALTIFGAPVRRAAQRAIYRAWGASVAWSMGMKVIVHGKAPEAPYYLVANHLSWSDIPLLAAPLGCTFVAMAEMAGWPLFGPMNRGVGTIFIDRKDFRDTKRVNGIIAEALDGGIGLAVFVESTTSNGEGVLPFRPSLLEPAVRRGIPVHYATLHYTADEGADVIAWVDDVPFMTHAVSVLRLPRINGHVTFGPHTLIAPDRKALAKAAEAAVAAQLPRRDG